MERRKERKLWKKVEKWRSSFVESGGGKREEEESVRECRECDGRVEYYEWIACEVVWWKVE